MNNIEKYILEKADVCRIEDLPDFPFKNFSEIIELEKQKKICIATSYNPEMLKYFDTKSDYVMQLIWTWLPYIVAFIYIVIAVIVKKYLLILSVPVILFGVYVSSPYNKFRRDLSGLSLIIFIILLFISKIWSFIVFSFLISLIFSWTAREQYNITMKNIVLSSEIIFTHLYSNEVIGIWDYIKEKGFGKV